MNPVTRILRTILQVLAAACDPPYAPAGTAAVTLFCLGAVLWVMFLVR